MKALLLLLLLAHVSFSGVWATPPLKLPTDGASVRHHTIRVPDTAAAPLVPRELLQQLVDSDCHVDEVNVASDFICSSVQVPPDDSHAFCESAGLNARLQNNIQQFFQAEYTCPSSDQARVRASCAQRSSGFAEDNLPAPYMSKGRSSMNDENWQQIVRRFPNVANMVHELHCRGYVASCTWHADSDAAGRVPDDELEALMFACEKPCYALVLSTDPVGATPDQIETACLVELKNGDTLVWRGPAGQQWGHVVFVPIGYTALRFRSRWVPKSRGRWAPKAVGKDLTSHPITDLRKDDMDEDDNNGGVGGGTTGIAAC